MNTEFMQCTIDFIRMNNELIRGSWEPLTTANVSTADVTTANVTTANVLG